LGSDANAEALALPKTPAGSVLHRFKKAMMSRLSCALGTLKDILFSGTIASGSVSHFSSVESFQIRPELFSPAE
jgi:Na+-translocating ferredoxin:NAD+ oxidoreductase RnfE subunit